MASAEAMRKEAERKRMLADAIDEESRAKRLRAEADTADKRAADLKSKADDSGEVVFGVLGFIAIIAGIVWLFG